MRRVAAGLSLLICTTGLAFVARAEAKDLAITVGGEKREAIVFLPTAGGDDPAPLVFVFHGHGGSAKAASEGFAIQDHWPEAIVVYMQGLPIVSKNDPEGKKAGWQHDPGGADDRDLKFFDRALERIKKLHAVDEKRTYAAGFSNGGEFALALWAARGELLAATAEVAPAGARKLTTDLKPKPTLLIGGRKDPLVTPEIQEEYTAAIRKLNGCREEGEAWGKVGTIYPSPKRTPVVVINHDGGHVVPETAGAQIAKFFKNRPKE